MTRHFDWLTKDDEGDFFQKVALDESGVRANQRPPAMTKTAAPTAPVRQTSFEKVASRLDRDLSLLASSGSVGINGGMQKRAQAYLDVVQSNVDLTPEQFDKLFDKVASVAIQTDLEAAYDQLVTGLPDHEHHIVDEILIKIGAELAQSALLEKEARGFNLSALHGIEEAAHAGKALNRGVRGAEEFTATERAAKTIGLPKAPPHEIGPIAKTRAGVAGAVNAAGEGAKAVGRAAAKPFVGAANKVRQWNTNRIMKAPEELSSALSKSRAAEAAGGLKGSVAKGTSKSLEKQHAAAVAKRDAKLNPAPKTDAPSDVAKATSTKTEGARQEGAAKAQEAAKAPGEPPKEPPKEKANVGGEGGGGEGHEHTPPPPGGANGKPPGFMDAWKKATTGGWKGLSAEEKGVLIRGGVTAALVTRAVTGHGAITGGQGLI